MVPDNQKIEGLSPEMTVFYEKAVRAYDVKNYSYAIDLLQSLLQVSFDCARARHLLHLSKQKATDASPRKGIGKVLHFPIAFCAALLCELQGNTARALDLFEQILTDYPKNVFLLQQLCRIFTRKGMESSLLYTYEEINQLSPRAVPPLRKLAALYYERKDYGRAREYYRKLYAVLPGDVSAEKALRDIDAIGIIETNFDPRDAAGV